ncbi:MAG: cold shock protein [Actinomycetota bacterium]|nr:cold shock protein [Actinomycetota bacterium]
MVETWDERGGHGTVRADGGPSYFFHCTQIVDGTRTIDVGATVTFEVVAGHRAGWEAVALPTHRT